MLGCRSTRLSSSTGLQPFPKVTSETDVFEKGVYAWTASSMDESLPDEQIIHRRGVMLYFYRCCRHLLRAPWKLEAEIALGIMAALET